jgi:hypothetical protein
VKPVEEDVHLAVVAGLRTSATKGFMGGALLGRFTGVAGTVDSNPA